MVIKIENKKGMTPIGVIFTAGLFIVVWAMFGAKLISDYGQVAVTQHGLIGLEAFLYMNLNYVIFIVFIVGMFAYMYWGSNNE